MVGVGVLSCVPLRNSDWMLDVGCWMLNQIVHVVPTPVIASTYYYCSYLYSYYYYYY